MWILAFVLGAAAVAAPPPTLAPGSRSQATAQPPAAAPIRASAIAFLEDKIRRDPEDVIALNLLAARYLDRLRERGDDRDLALAADMARRSLEVLPAEQNVGGLAAKARTDQASHRFASARDEARRLTALDPGKSFPYQILGDALLELGSYEEAGAAYEEMQRLDGGSADAESRLARLALIRGRDEEARTHLSAALAYARQLMPPRAELVAWSAVRLGELSFARGEWEEAELQYRGALEALPDGLLALEHVAELRAAEQRYPEAIDLYGKVIARSSRPEFLQALGDVLTYAGRSSEAKPRYEKALAGYLKSVSEGHVHFFHHLSGFYSDSQPDPEQAIAWARKDMELRHSIYAWDALAWALHGGGRSAEARDAMQKALSTGARDAHLFYHAGMIASSAGDLASGKKFLRRAVEVNPRYNSFHVHR